MLSQMEGFSPFSWLNNMSVCVCVCVCVYFIEITGNWERGGGDRELGRGQIIYHISLSIHPSIDTEAVSTFG